MKKRERYQLGQVVQVGETWRFRYRETDTEGNVSRPSELIGTVEQYPTKAKASKAAEKLRQRVNDVSRVVYFNNLCDRYEQSEEYPTRGSVKGSYDCAMRRFRAAWGNKRLDWMTSPEGITAIETWFRTLQTLGHSGYPVRPMALKSRSIHKGYLHYMFTLAMKWGFIAVQRNPMDLINLRNLPVAVRIPKKRPSLTVELYHAILNDPALIQPVWVAIQVAANTGMGRSEFLGLQWSDIDYKNGFFWIRRSVVGPHVDATKTVTRHGSYPMHPELAELMREWQRTSPKVGDWVFGSLITGRPYNGASWQKYFLRPCGERLGLQSLGWHSFRHFYRKCQRLLGHSLETQKMLMRHSKITTTMKYGEAEGIERAEEVRPFNAQIVEMLKPTGTTGRLQ